MIFLGHLGFGLKLASPWSRRLDRKLILLGAILPDLVDKPIYYGLSWATGKRGAELGMIAGTRGIGHTALALIVLTLTATVTKLRWLAALCLGIATHLLLDNLGDRLLNGPNSSIKALVWPFLGRQFPPYPFLGLKEHLGKSFEPYFLITESLGFLILLWEYWKVRRRNDIARGIRSLRA